MAGCIVVAVGQRFAVKRWRHVSTYRPVRNSSRRGKL